MLEKRTLVLTEKKKNMNKRPILVAFSNQKGGYLNLFFIPTF